LLLSHTNVRTDDVAAVTSVASVAYSVLAAPLPMRDASRLVRLWGDNPSKQPAHFPLSGEEYRGSPSTSTRSTDGDTTRLTPSKRHGA
jgi:hypothetical protein